MPAASPNPTDKPPTSEPSGRAAARARSADERKFAISFACQLVQQKVQFRWTEIAEGEEAGLERLQLASLTCSGIGKNGCPVQPQSLNLAAWKQCPRIKKLTIRLAPPPAGHAPAESTNG